MTLRPSHISFLIHLGIGVSFYAVTKLQLPDHSVIEVPIEISAPAEVQNLTQAAEKPKVVVRSVNEPEARTKEAREVFGTNRNSYTDDSVGEEEAVAAKKGNTLGKASDQEVLKDSDADSLPTPTEEYLVSEMPSVLSEIRPRYPSLAKEQGLEGAVVMDILIDEKGAVRQASLIEGPDIFRAGALEAIKKFVFRPAKVDGSPVAVRIRYTLRFQLEY